MQQYLLEFETKLDKTTSLGIVWPDDIIAFRLLKNANLPEQDHRLAKATVGGLEYEKVKEKLSSIFGETETNCASSVKFEELNITDSIDIQDDNNEDESNDVYYGNQYQTTRTSGYNNRNPQYNQNNNPNYNNQNNYQNDNNQNFPSNNGNPRQQNSFPPPQQNVNVPNRQQPMFTRGNNRSRPFQQNRGRTFATSGPARRSATRGTPTPVMPNKDSPDKDATHLIKTANTHAATTANPSTIGSMNVRISFVTTM